MSSSEIAIKVKNLSKKYVIGKQKDSSLRGTLVNLFKSNKSDEDEFCALEDVNFEINKGDVIGIIGKNGAGKSTLLKVLSQITSPTEGRIEINGRVASLLEVGTGFHPELTGRENIFLNGTILGMTRKEVKAKLDEIIEFSGVEKFIDTPVKHYSSGMYVRLAFAVAAHLEPEILIIDEVLAVGDAEFQKKCLGKMKDVAAHGRTVLFVSHNIEMVRSLCSKSILLEQGKLINYAPTNEIINEYLSTQNNTIEQVELKKNADVVAFSDITCYSAKGNNGNVFFTGEELSFKLDYKNPKLINDNVRVVIDIFDESGNIMFRLINQNVIDHFELNNQSGSFICTINKNPLTKGKYLISCRLYSLLRKEFHDNLDFVKSFEVENAPFYANRLVDKMSGKVLVEQQWKMDEG